MTRFHNRNGVRIQFTAEEESLADAGKTQAVIDIQAEKDADAQKAIDKANAVSKLEALGLTSSEINALTGG